MRAVVTGAAGFVGSHLVDALLAQGLEVVGVDDHSTGDPRNLAAAALHRGFTFVRADVSRELPVDAPVDLVLHFASPASPADYARLPLHTLAVNSEGTRRACDLAERCGARLIYASTSEIYGEPLEHPQRESYWGNVHSAGPRACYDEGKRFGEALVTTRVRCGPLDARIVRIFNTYGPRMRPDDGRVIPAFVGAALRGEPLVLHGDGTQTRSFTYVDDLVSGVLALARADGARGAIVNLGNPVETSIEALARIVAELAAVPLRVERAPRPLDDPSRRRPDIAYARALLGWEPRIGLRTGLARVVDDARERLGQRSRRCADADVVALRNA